VKKRRMTRALSGRNQNVVVSLTGPIQTAT
jgi:hypothetical protein